MANARTAILATVIVGAALVAPAITAWVVTRDAPSALGDLVPAPTPLTGTIADEMINVPQPVTITLTTKPAQEIYGSGLSGTVTNISLVPDSEVVNGMILYSVDRFPVRAWTDPTVLFREIGPQATGDDVMALQRFLAVVNHTDLDITGTYNQQTRRAITEYEKASGIRQPSGIFKPEWVTRAPEGVLVDTVSVKLAAPGPSTLEVLAKGAPEIGLITIEPSAGQNSPLTPGNYVIAKSGMEITATLLDDLWTVGDPAFLLEASVKDEGSSIPNIQISRLDAQLRSTIDLSGFAVGASGLITNPDGSTCIAIRTSTGWETVHVDPVRSKVDGTVLLTASELTANMEYLVNPGETEPELECN